MMFKVGDKVRFKKEFYKEEYFKKLNRSARTIVAELAGQGSFYVYYAGAERVHVYNEFHSCYDIDSSLFELCDKDVPKTEPAKVKVGDKIRITRYQSGDKVGTVSEVVRLTQGGVYYKSKKSSGGVYGATNDAYEIVTEPEVKEVNRVAKVGEWIKIVHAVMAGSYYKDGDILKVVRIGGNSVYIECGTVVWLKEYVVLENYMPEEKESEIPKEEPKKQIAKVGDFIKIKEWSGGDKIGTIAEVVGIGCRNRVEYKSSNSPYGTYFSSFYEIVEPPKRKWTPEEIVQAKCFLAEELIYAKCRFVYDNVRRKTECYNFETNKLSEAKCAPNDEFNQYIGAVVAYCKTCGVKIPEFIKH